MQRSLAYCRRLFSAAAVPSSSLARPAVVRCFRASHFRPPRGRVFLRAASFFDAARPSLSSPPPLLPQLGPKPNIHRSNAEELIARVPVVEVAGNTAMCDGGGGNMGHPSAFFFLPLRARFCAFPAAPVFDPRLFRPLSSPRPCPQLSTLS